MIPEPRDRGLLAIVTEREPKMAGVYEPGFSVVELLQVGVAAHGPHMTG